MNDREQSISIENEIDDSSGSINEKHNNYPDDDNRNTSNKDVEESVKRRREEWQKGLEQGSVKEGNNPTNRDKNDPPPALSTDKDETLGVP